MAVFDEHDTYRNETFELDSMFDGQFTEEFDERDIVGFLINGEPACMRCGQHADEFADTEPLIEDVHDTDLDCSSCGAYLPYAAADTDLDADTYTTSDDTSGSWQPTAGGRQLDGSDMDGLGVVDAENLDSDLDEESDTDLEAFGLDADTLDQIDQLDRQHDQDLLDEGFDGELDAELDEDLDDADLDLGIAGLEAALGLDPNMEPDQDDEDW